MQFSKYFLELFSKKGYDIGKLMQNVVGGAGVKNIVFIAPDAELFSKGKRLKRNQYKELIVRQGLIHEGVQVALRESQKGAEVFVTRGRTAEAIRQSDVSGVVVDVPITAYDILRAILQAKKQGSKFSLIVYSGMIHGIENLNELLQMDFTIHFIEDETDAEVKVGQAICEGAEVIIGGETTSRVARRRNIPFVQIETGEEALVQAFEEAKRIMEIRALEKTRIKLLETVTHYTADAMLIVDESLVVRLCNWTLCEMTHLREKEIIGSKLFEIWPELDRKKFVEREEDKYDELLVFRGTDVLCSKTFIKVGKKITGMVLSFQEVAQIQKREAKLRRSIYVEDYRADRTFENVQGKSTLIQNIIQTGKQFALTESAILIVGETGTGKNLFAESLHSYSRRSMGAYVSVECSSLSENAFGKIMLGQVGTSSHSGKSGLFEIAHKGTLLFNEITELDIKAQSKLLSILQQQKVTRLGSEKALPVDVRVIASTSQNIREKIKEGNFRADLYYQLNVLQLKIPKLEERREDIPVLAQSFLKKLASGQRRKMYFQEDALMLLYRRQWQGNVKELYNVIERIVATCHEEEISKKYLQSILDPDQSIGPFSPHDLLKYDQIDILRQALKESKGNQGVAAKKLGIDRSTLWRRMKKLGLK